MDGLDNDLAVGVGMLTPEQVTNQLPFSTPAMADTLTMRLLTRGSLPSVALGNGIRIPVDKLRAFIVDGGRNSAARAALGLPMETLEPIFPFAFSGMRNWFGGGPAEFAWTYWRQDLLGELQNQLPQRVILDPTGEMSNLNPAVRFVKSASEKVVIRAQPTDALVKIARQPAPQGLPFANLSEYHLAKRLHELAWWEQSKIFLPTGIRPIQNTINLSFGTVGNIAPTVEGAEPAELRVNLPSKSPTASITGPEYFYHSSAHYRAITTAAANDLSTTASLTLSQTYPKLYGIGNSGWPDYQESPRDVILVEPLFLQLMDMDLMRMAGSNEGRLICLAF